MGILNEIKKEWTWANTIQQWPDFLAILPAVYFAERYGKHNFWAWMLIWILVFITAKFCIRLIVKIIKEYKS
jgi:hypothetical protein